MSVHPSVEANRPVVDTGDRVFLGVDSATAPEKLQPGLVSRASNTRFRSQRVRGRPITRVTGLMGEEFWPYVQELNNSTTLTGSVTDTTLTISSGSIDSVWLTDFGGVPLAEYQNYLYVRFDSGRVMQITEYTSSTSLEVEDEAYHAEDASGTFVITKNWSENPYPRQEIFQAGQAAIESTIFSDPNGYEYGLVATQTAMWGFRDYERPFEITVPGGIPDGLVDIVQCFDKVLALRGDDLPVLEYDGSDTNTFTSITATSESGYTDPIPNSRLGIFIKDRLFVVSGRDTIYHSDIGVYTRFKEFESGFRVNQGTADSITALYPYGDEAFLVGFTRSIYLVYNIYGDLSDMSVKLISSATGIAGKHCICGTGDDVWFMDAVGDIWPLSRVDETRQQVGGKPVSWPIRPQMDEYGFHKPGVVRMIGHGDHVFVAFAGTGATVEDMPSGREITKPNFVAVYDIVTGHWAGIDSYYYMDHTGWLYTRYGSRNQLLFVGRYGGIYQYASPSGENSWSMTTRGYELDAAATEHGVKLGMAWTSQGADITINTLRDGAGTSNALETNLTRNRLRYLVHAKTNWDPTNSNLDFDDPDREDYAIVLADSATGMFLNDAGGGVDTTLEQSYVEVYDLDGFQDYLQVQFTNNASDSRCSLRAVKLSAIEGNHDFGIQ